MTLTYLRRYERAEKYYDLSISLDPSRALPYLDKSSNRLLWKGSAREARAILGEIPPNPQNDEILFLPLFRQELLEGRPSQAIQRLASTPEPILWEQEEMAPRELLAAEAHALLPDKDRARVLYQSAKTILEQEAKKHPEDARVRSALAFALAGLGRKDEAIQQAKLAAELPPQDAILRPYRLKDLALVYTSLGEHEAALDQIEHLLSIPSLLSPQLVRSDPRWSPLRSHPRFEALIQGHRPP